jgi:hypothetical protein
MKKTITLFCLVISSLAFAQEPVFTIGSQRSMSSFDNPEAISFRIGKNNYVLFRKFKMSEGMLLHLEGFSDPGDGFLCSQDIPIPHVPNEIAIYEGFVALSDKMILFRSVFNKDEKKSVLYAHELNEKGMIMNDAGKVITSISAEKAMNSGNFIVKASADGLSFVVLSEFPFVKETKEKFACTVFDKSMNQNWTKEIELQYDSRRGPVNDVALSNAGIVYITKKVEGPKNADFYTCYQVADKGVKVKENVINMEDPKKIVNYGYVIDESTSDITIAGYYTEDGKVSIGGTGFKGYFTAKISGSTGEFISRSSNPFEKTQSNLRIAYVLNVKGNIFLLGEEKYESNVATEQKDSKGFPVYNREFYADKIHVSVFDAAGKSIINTILPKNNKSVEDGGFFNSFAATIVGEQIMIVYNDYQYKHDGQDHKVIGPGLASVKIPVIQFFGADGSTGKKFALIDKNIGGKRGEVFLCPEIFIPLTNKEFFFLGKHSGSIYPLRMKLP